MALHPCFQGKAKTGEGTAPLDARPQPLPRAPRACDRQRPRTGPGQPCSSDGLGRCSSPTAARAARSGSYPEGQRAALPSAPHRQQGVGARPTRRRIAAGVGSRSRFALALTGSRARGPVEPPRRSRPTLCTRHWQPRHSSCHRYPLAGETSPLVLSPLATARFRFRGARVLSLVKVLPERLTKEPHNAPRNRGAPA